MFTLNKKPSLEKDHEKRYEFMINLLRHYCKMAMFLEICNIIPGLKQTKNQMPS